jgi:transposase
MVHRLVGPNAVSATRLAREVGVPQVTLSRWLREAQHGEMGTSKGVQHKPPTPPTKEIAGQKLSADDKVRIVFAAESLAAEDLGALLRREGVHDAELEAWRVTIKTAAVAAFNGTASRAVTAARSADRKRIQELERELRRKDKALAEAAALLVLEKKLQALWGDGDDAMDTRSGG